MRRLSLAFVAVCLVALVAAEVAQAQISFGAGRGGWGGRGGTSWGIGVGTPNYGFSYGRNPWGGTGWSGYVGQPYYGGFGQPYYGGGWYGGYPAYGWGRTYATPGWTYSYPSTGYYSGSGYYPSGSYYTGMPQTYGTAGYQASYHEPSSNQALLRVSVPDTAARVWVEGQPTQQMGTSRVFVSPPLEPGTYHYNVKASWMENGREVTREQKVTVEPGREVAVNFATGRGAPGRADAEFQDQNRDRAIQDPLRDRDRDRAIENPLRDPARPNERDRDLNRDLNRDINRDLNRDRDLNKDLNRTPAPGAVTPVSGTPAQTTPPAPGATPADRPVAAKVVRVDKDQLVVSLTDGGRERTYRIAADTPIMVNGTKSALTTLKPGMQLSISTQAGTPTTVTRIEATNPADPGGNNP